MHIHMQYIRYSMFIHTHIHTYILFSCILDIINGTVVYLQSFIMSPSLYFWNGHGERDTHIKGMLLPWSLGPYGRTTDSSNLYIPSKQDRNKHIYELKVSNE